VIEGEGGRGNTLHIALNSISNCSTALQNGSTGSDSDEQILVWYWRVVDEYKMKRRVTKRVWKGGGGGGGGGDTFVLIEVVS
jgi:hypothetical protein